jgi:glycosyltransferase involved in cell wall biosynthesis
LSQHYCGDIQAVVNDRRYGRAKLTKFRLRGLYLPTRLRHFTLSKVAIFSVYVIINTLYLHYFKHKYTAIVAPEPLVSGMIALFLSKVTGAAAIVEVNGQFESAFRFEGGKQTVMARLKHGYTQKIVPYVLRRASAVRLLYADQVRTFMGPGPLPNAFAFADFVSIHQFQPAQGDSKYILFVGYPWHLKGVDVLISAFNEVSAEFPEWSLKVVGYCPDKSPFVKLANGNERIVLSDPVEYSEVVKLMAECSLFVLPSRTEAMGRVLLEAMASRKPIIASNVDGIPSVVKDGETGLLFESENVSDLAAKLRRILANPGYAAELAENGYDHVHRHLSERCYVSQFTHMVESVTGADGDYGIREREHDKS